MGGLYNYDGEETVRLEKKEDWRRRISSFSRHMGLLIMPMVYAAAITAAWYYGQPIFLQYRIPHADREFLMGVIALILLMPFALSGSMVLSESIKKYREVQRTVYKKDERTFMELRDERMSNSLHVFLFVPALLLEVEVWLFDYSSSQEGASCVFAVSLAFTVFWAVLGFTEDPTRSPWLRKRVPAHWLTQDADVYFELQRD
jgi:positive regulator of sigma E activity